MESTRTTPMIEPVRKTIAVAAPVERAFRVFTEQIDDWWPLRTHSVHEERAEGAGLEPRVGGALFEIGPEGRELWGTITVWEPPQRVVYTWHPGRSVDEATEVEIRFTPQDGGTLVELEHRGWEVRGARAQAIRDNYDSGWDPVLERFAQAAGGPR